MRVHTSSTSLTYAQASWIFALSSSAQGLLMPLSGLFLERAFGPRMTCLLGFVIHRCVPVNQFNYAACVIILFQIYWFLNCSFAVLMTRLTIEHSFALVLVTYGALLGCGISISYPVTIALVVQVRFSVVHLFVYFLSSAYSFSFLFSSSFSS